MGSRFDYRGVAVDSLRRSRAKPDLLGLLYWLWALRHSPSDLPRSAIVATRRPAQGVLIDDASRHMGPRSMFRSRYVLELEILFRGADDLFRRHYHLLYLRSMGRWKAVTNAPTAIGRARRIGTCRFFVKAT